MKSFSKNYFKNIYIRFGKGQFSKDILCPAGIGLKYYSPSHLQAATIWFVMGKPLFSFYLFNLLIQCCWWRRQELPRDIVPYAWTDVVQMFTHSFWKTLNPFPPWIYVQNLNIFHAKTVCQISCSAFLCFNLCCRWVYGEISVEASYFSAW